MDQSIDVAVIGAGPAGLAAAREVVSVGLNVLLLDENTAPGGQVYRGIGQAGPGLTNVLGAEYAAGRPLAAVVALPGVAYRPGATVWNLTPTREIFYSIAGKSFMARADVIILATGALERAMPFPGWTLPGVMTAGAAQTMLKASGLLPAGPVVLAGSGPLLLLLAQQFIRAGSPPAAILETTPARNRFAALRHVAGAVAGWKSVAKGIAMLRAIRTGNVQHLPRVAALRAVTDDTGQLASVRFSVRGEERQIACRTLLLHNGVVPNVQASRMLGLPHRWHAGQRCWVPEMDGNGRTGFAGIFIAGDGGGIGGAAAAAHAGAIAGRQAAVDLGALSGTQFEATSRVDRSLLARERRFRPFLEALYQPADEFLDPPDEVIVCRCEEVTAGTLRACVRGGALGPSQVKAFCRAGMGPCQGRTCGLVISEIIARARGVTPNDVGYLNLRPPLKPVTVGEIAAIPLPEDEQGKIVAGF